MTHRTATTKRNSLRPIRYFGEIISELKKVVWLSRREAAYLTLLVLVVSISAGIVLGAIDFGFSSLIDRIILGK